MTLRGLCWDHPRCVAPMRAAAAAWPEVGGGRVAWDARPLSAFNDQPLGELVDAYDLLFVDHPFVGTAVETGGLVPLDELVEPDVLAALAADAIGPSHAAYALGGHQWALATDAACQVSVARADLLRERPRTWDDVLALARTAPGSVAIPLYPADALCSLLTIAASSGRPLGSRFDRRSVELLAALAALVDPACLDRNPPALLDAMRDGDRIAYVPLTFGYAPYADRLSFGPIPDAGRGPRGAILGGAGLAVSARSPRAADAARFAAWVTSADVQRAIVARNGGQPGSASAWRDPALDPHGFFAATRETLEHAWVRPRDPWWPAFHRVAGEALNRALRERRDPGAIAADLDALLAAHQTQTKEAIG